MICMLPPEVGQSTRYMIQELVKYMSELAICVYSFVKYKPSLKAFACVLVASESLEGDDCLSDESKRIFVSNSPHVLLLRLIMLPDGYFCSNIRFNCS